jgi:hypothetical protein
MGSQGGQRSHSEARCEQQFFLSFLCQPSGYESDETRSLLEVDQLFPNAERTFHDLVDYPTQVRVAYIRSARWRIRQWPAQKTLLSSPKQALRGEPMAPAMMGMRSLRYVLDRFCADHGLAIGSPAALDVARHCLAIASLREYQEQELLVELEEWYAVSYARSQNASVSVGPNQSSDALEQPIKRKAA